MTRALTRLRFVALKSAPVALLVAAGCLASKSDIRLIQDESRATRETLARGDTSLMRSNDALREQVRMLSQQLERAMDSLRSVATRLANFQATATGNFEVMNQQMIQMQALLGQTTRGLQDTRTQIQAMREQGMATGGTISPTNPPGDSLRMAPGVPGAATLYTTAIESINQGAYATGRRSLEQLLASYPDNERAPAALLKIGDTYKAERNLAAADSVYRLVPDRFPKSPEVATALYLRGKPLWDAGKRNEAMVLFNRIRRDFPNSSEAQLVKDLTNPRD